MILSTTTGVLERRFGFDDAVRHIAEAGFDAYDIDMSKIHVEDTPLCKDNYREYTEHLKGVADECRISCNQAHAPFPVYLNGNDEYNKMTFDLIIRSMECASLLGAKHIVFHPIKNSTSSHVKQYSYELFNSRQELYDANIEFFNKLIPYCKKYNIKIAVENMWERHPMHQSTLIPAFLGNSEEHASFIDALDSEWIVGCIDIGHCLICGEKPQDAICRLGRNRLKALHVHDCNCYEDTHTLPYSMNTDWDAILKALKDIDYDGDFTFEADSFFKNYPDDLVADALQYMQKVGRFMAGKIK